jgi:hypothetical protein
LLLEIQIAACNIREIMMERFVAVVSTDETAKVIKSQYIHDDIAFSILSKLPIKSFKRFLCVCKS